MLRGLGFHIEIKKETFESLFAQTIRARAFIFGIKHHLVTLYQISSNYGPGVENKPYVIGFHIEMQKEIF